MTCPALGFQNAFLPTMPEDLLVQARTLMGSESVTWYSKCCHHALLGSRDQSASDYKGLGGSLGSTVVFGLHAFHALLCI